MTKNTRKPKYNLNMEILKSLWITKEYINFWLEADLDSLACNIYRIGQFGKLWRKCCGWYIYLTISIWLDAENNADLPTSMLP